jgi:DegV family protein with EDD domain
MSATYRSASLAARLAGGGRVRVVDTGSAAGGEGLVVLAAARAAAAGRPLDAVEQAARRAAAAVRLVAAVAGFDRLVRSGRVPALAGWAGERLGVQPLFAFSGGSVRPLRPAANRSAALARLLRLLVDDVRRAGTPPPAVHVAVLHAGAAGEAGGLLERVAALTDPATAFVAEFSTVMVAHTGPGLIGLAWRCETRPAERASERAGPAGSARRR